MADKIIENIVIRNAKTTDDEVNIFIIDSEFAFQRFFRYIKDISRYSYYHRMAVHNGNTYMGRNRGWTKIYPAT